MSYNPHIHHRRSIRLKGYDYSQAGAYFITICCDNRKNRFGKIENNEMLLNEFGTIAYNEWAKLPERFPNFELDVFQIMPNHIHGIVTLVGATGAVGATLAVAHDDTNVQSVGAGFTPAQNDNDTQQPQTNTGQPQTNTNTGQPQGLPLRNTDDNIRAGVNPAHTVGDIVGAYKSLVANECLKIFKSKNETMGKIWQRNYYENIIKNEPSYQTISAYIINNPSNWKDDKFYNP